MIVHNLNILGVLFQPPKTDAQVASGCVNWLPLIQIPDLVFLGTRLSLFRVELIAAGFL